MRYASPDISIRIVLAGRVLTRSVFIAIHSRRISACRYKTDDFIVRIIIRDRIKGYSSISTRFLEARPGRQDWKFVIASQFKSITSKFHLIVIARARISAVIKIARSGKRHGEGFTEKVGNKGTDVGASGVNRSPPSSKLSALLPKTY